jgi:hypothetical protein
VTLRLERVRPVYGAVEFYPIPEVDLRTLRISLGIGLREAARRITSSQPSTGLMDPSSRPDTVTVETLVRLLDVEA